MKLPAEKFPAVASLLLAGEETLPSVPVSLNHLHSCVGALVKAAADALDDDDEDEAIISDPEESLAQEERLEHGCGYSSARRVSRPIARLSRRSS